MAATLGIAIMETAVDMAGLDSGLSEAQSKTDNAAGGISGVLNGALGGIATVGIAAGAAVAAGVAAIGAAAFDVAGQVQGATNNIQAELGVTAERAAELGQIAKDVWANNFGADIADAAAAVSTVRQQLGDLADNELQRATENAFRLADVFELEVGESTNAAGALMEQFGLSADQAFDLVTSGLQSGLNNSGDFIDSIGEYSNQFADAGFSADQMFSIMQTGLAAGVLGTDKISDAIKEMVIKLNEGSDDTKAAFDTIGLSYEDIAAKVADGSQTWADSFDDIVAGINAIEDPIERQKAQVAIFGTMAEDLGVSFTEGLSSATTALEDMAGATDGLDVKYNNLSDMMEGFKRQALAALEPLGALLLNIGNSVMPIVQKGFEWFGTTLVPMIIEAGKAIAELIALFTGFGAETYDTLDAVRELAFAFGLQSEAVDKLEEIIRAVADVLGTVLSNAIENARLAVDAVIDLFNGDFAGAFENLQEIVENAIENVVTTFETLVDLIGPVLEDVWNAFTDWLNNTDFAALGLEISNMILEGLGEFIAWIGPMLAEWAGAFWDWVQSVDWIGLATDILTAIWDGLNAFGDFAGAILGNWATVFWEWVQSVDWLQLATDILTAIVDGLNAFNEFATPILEGWFTSFVNWVQDTDWIGLAESILTAIVEGLKAFAEWVGPILEGWVEAFIGWVESVDWLGLGSSIVQGIIDGIANMTGAAAEALIAIAQTMWDRWVKFWQFGSPSKKMAQTGADLMAGLAQGIQQNGNLPGNALLSIAQDIELDVINQLSDMMGKIGGMMITFITALKAMAGISGIDASVLPQFRQFMDTVHEILRGFIILFWTIVEDAGSILNTFDRIPKISDAISKSAKAIQDGVGAIVALAGMPNLPADMGARMETLKNFIKTIVGHFIEISAIMDLEMAEAVKAFAEAADKVLGLVEDGIDAAAALSAVDFGPIVQGWHLRDQIVIFRNIIRTVMREFAEAAVEINGDLAGAVADFANAADKVIGLVIDGLEAVTALSQIDFGPIVQGFHLRDQIVIFRQIIATIVREFAAAADDISKELADQIKRFADSAGKLLGLIQPGIEGIKQLSEYVKAANIGAAAAAFAKDLVQAIKAMVLYFEEAVSGMASALAEAAVMAGDMKQLLAVIKPGIEAIEAVAKYVTASDIEKKAAAFAMDLVKMANVLVKELTAAAKAIGNEALKAAAAFAKDLAELAAEIADALKSLNEIGSAKLPDISKALQYISQTSDQIATVLVKSRGTLSPNVVAAAKAFNQNVKVMVDDILAALANLQRLFNANVPGSLQNMLDTMQRNLYSRAPQAGKAAGDIAKAVANAFTSIAWESIGAGIADGITRGINKGAGGVAAAAKAAAQAAFKAAQSALQAASPSKLFEKLGHSIPEGMAQGIRARGYMAENELLNLAGNLAAIPAGNTANYYQFEMRGDGLSTAQQIDVMIEAALMRRGIRAETLQRS